MTVCSFCELEKDKVIYIGVTSYRYCSNGDNGMTKESVPICRECYEPRLKRHIDLLYR